MQYVKKQQLRIFWKREDMILCVEKSWVQSRINKEKSTYIYIIVKFKDTKGTEKKN